MDAFSVSLANGLGEPGMKLRRMMLTAGIFAFFQALMPMIGWICVRTAVEGFRGFEIYVPWIALILLTFVGGKMIYDGIKGGGVGGAAVGIPALLLQGVATSIDALSAGFATSDYGAAEALTASSLIAAVTFVICTAGLIIGRKAGTFLAGKAQITGGIILIAIGIEIFFGTR